MWYIISLDANLTTWNLLYNSLKPSGKFALIIDNVFVWNDSSNSLHLNCVLSDKKAQYRIKNTQLFPLLYVVKTWGQQHPQTQRPDNTTAAEGLKTPRNGTDVHNCTWPSSCTLTKILYIYKISIMAELLNKLIYLISRNYSCSWIAQK